MQKQIKNAGKVALLGGLGGVVGAGAKMLVEPSLFKDQTKMQKLWWVTPLGELLLGAVGGAFDKTALVGAGLAGAGISHAVENANTAIAIKKNAQPAPTAGFTGALVMPNELPAGNPTGALFGGVGLSQHTGYVNDTGALVMPSYSQ